MKEHVKEIPGFKNDEDLGTFMERHDGFELVDQELAEIVETPVFSKRGKSYIALDPETAELLHELVTAGVCATPSDGVYKAVQSYVLAVLPHTYKLVRETYNASLVLCTTSSLQSFSASLNISSPQKMDIPGLCIFEGFTNVVQKVITGAFILIAVLAKAKGMSGKL